MSTATVSFMRDSTTLDSTTVTDASAGVTFMVVDNPGAGSYTYKINVDALVAAPDVVAGKRTIIVLLAKK